MKKVRAFIERFQTLELFRESQADSDRRRFVERRVKEIRAELDALDGQSPPN